MKRASSQLRRKSSPRRAVVLLAVMFAVVMLSASASIVLLRADAQSSRTVSMLRYSQSRAAAWSGVKSVLAELASQRPVLLQGGEPQITASVSLVEATERTPVLARLVTLGPGEGTVIQSEAAKVNINTADEAMLAASSLADPGEIAAMLEHRRGGPVGSLNDLSGQPSISIERIYGRVLGAEAPAATSGLFSGASVAAEPVMPSAVSPSGTSTADPLAPTIGGGARSTRSGALADVCTVFSADPTVQVGIGPEGAKYSGVSRINLGLGWRDELAGPVAERFGSDAVQTTRQLLQTGAKFKSMRDVVLVLKQLGVPVRQWGSLLDAFTTTADPFELGKVDTLRASAAVLATVPGIDASAAERMVAVRDRLDAAVRREITWPLLEGILTTEQFELAIDRITNRSLQWRVIVEAGRARRTPSGDPSELSDRVIYEAVLDVAGRAPRVAYLREVTALSAVRGMALAPKASSEEAGSEAEVGFEADSAGMSMDGADRTSGVLEPDPMVPDAAPDAAAESADSPAAEAPVPGEASEVGAGAAETGAAETSAGVDRRNGRWIVRRGQGGGA